jgi:hypothetical protein
MAAGDERQRRAAFAVPPIDDPPSDIDPSLLDPGDPDERSLLLRAAHPDFDAAIDAGESVVIVDGHEVNARLHLAVHEIVATELVDDDPPEAWATARRLSAAGYAQHEVLHMLGSTVAGELGQALSGHREYDREAHVAALDALPDSWEGMRPGGPAPPASRASHERAARQRRKAARAARRRNRRR